MNVLLLITTVLYMAGLAKSYTSGIFPVRIPLPPSSPTAVQGEIKSVTSSGWRRTYINKEQWKSIDRILQHPQSTPEMLLKVREIIYYHYRQWAETRAYHFRRFHRHKCRAIPLEELALYSQYGLHRATQNYNGNSSFLPYANLYVMGELYKGMTELYPITSIPAHIRRKKTHRNQTTHHRKQLNTHFVGENEWRLDKLAWKYSIAPYTDGRSNYLEKESQQENMEKIWSQVAQMSPVTQRIFQMKYGRALWDWAGEGNRENKPISNRKIGERLGYSEEFVRKNIQKIKRELSPLFTTPIFM
jgi:RNA polymerase sigma factor (sigma-70 family)